MSETVVLVQARQGSARYPGKSLRPLAGRPMILHVLERAKEIDCGPVWLATSINERDDELAKVVSLAGYTVYRGSEWDVLQRMSEAARLARAETVVRLTGDCPLLAPEVSRAVLDLYVANGADAYTSNDTARSGWPDGLDTEVFPADLLHHMADRTTDPLDREHVTRAMRKSLASELHATFLCQENWTHVKLSVDTVEDFNRVANVLSFATDGTSWPSTRAAYLRWQGWK